MTEILILISKSTFQHSYLCAFAYCLHSYVGCINFVFYLVNSSQNVDILSKNYSIFTWTPELPEKFQNAIFWRFLKFLQLDNSNRSKNNPKKFFWKYLKNDGRYGRSKFWHSRWRCWFAGWNMTKIFLSI